MNRWGLTNRWAVPPIADRHLVPETFRDYWWLWEFGLATLGGLDWYFGFGFEFWSRKSRVG